MLHVCMYVCVFSNYIAFVNIKMINGPNNTTGQLLISCQYDSYAALLR